MRRGGALVLGVAVLTAAVDLRLASARRRRARIRPRGVGCPGLDDGRRLNLTGYEPSIAPDPATEGDDVTLRITARRRSRIPGSTVIVTGALDRLGSFECRLRGHRPDRQPARLRSARSREGDSASSDATLELRDPLGLETRSSPLGTAVSVVVYPRLVELDNLFSDAGRFGSDGRRFLLRRPAGFDLHSVRDYEQGESLRRVHWPTTARRGHLMVKELEESPRDSVVVVLDCDPAGQAGDPPDSSFDQAARAAGSILRVYAVRGRRAVLVTTGKDGCPVSAGSPRDGFRLALGALAVAESDASARACAGARAGSLPGSSCGRARDRDLRALRPRQRRDSCRCRSSGCVSVVWIDAPSYLGAADARRAGVLRLGRGWSPGGRGPVRRRPRRRAPGPSHRGACSWVERWQQRCLPAVVVAVSWIRLEEPARLRELVLVVLLALGPALVRPGVARMLDGRRRRSLPSSGSHSARSPWELLPFRDERVVGPIVERLGSAVGDYYDSSCRSISARHAEMHAVVARRGLRVRLRDRLARRGSSSARAAAVTVAGVGWPATLARRAAQSDRWNARACSRVVHRISCFARDRHRRLSSVLSSRRWWSPERPGRPPRRRSRVTPFSTGRPGIFAERRPRHRACGSSGTRSTTGSGSRPSRRRCCGSPAPTGRSTGARRRWTRSGRSLVRGSLARRATGVERSAPSRRVRTRGSARRARIGSSSESR